MSDELHTETGDEPVEKPAEPATSPEMAEGAKRNASRMANLAKAVASRKAKAAERKAKEAARAAKRAESKASEATVEQPKAPVAPEPPAPSFASAKELAEFLAQLDAGVNAVVPEDSHVKPVTKALAWANADGSPTARNLQACTMAWPWLVKNGVLEGLNDAAMAAIAAAILLGPAILAAVQLYRKPAAHQTTAVPAAGPRLVEDAAAATQPAGAA